MRGRDSIRAIHQSYSCRHLPEGFLRPFRYRSKWSRESKKKRPSIGLCDFWRQKYRAGGGTVARLSAISNVQAKGFSPTALRTPLSLPRCCCDVGMSPLKEQSVFLPQVSCCFMTVLMRRSPIRRSSRESEFCYSHFWSRAYGSMARQLQLSNFLCYQGILVNKR